MHRALAMSPVALLLASCGVVLTPLPAETIGAAQGNVKTVKARIQQGTNSVSSREVEVSAAGANVSGTPVSEGNSIWAYSIPGSAAWPAGTVVDVTWRVEYGFLGLSDQTNTKSMSFTVLPPTQPNIVLPPNVCMQQGQTVPVEIDVQSGTANVALAVTPASLATPTPATLPVTTAGNSFNLAGVQTGSGTLAASAPGFDPDTVNVTVAATQVAATLVAPADGATGVYWDSPPPAGAASVQVFLDWNDAPAATEYRIHYAEGNGPFTFTNSIASEIYLAWSPGTVIRWKVQARFPACAGDGFGPESPERSFTVWEAASP